MEKLTESQTKLMAKSYDKIMKELDVFIKDMIKQDSENILIMSSFIIILLMEIVATVLANILKFSESNSLHEDKIDSILAGLKEGIMEKFRKLNSNH